MPPSIPLHCYLAQNRAGHPMADTGFMINTETTPTGRSSGSLAWAGLLNAYYWLDPTKRLAGVLLTQILPFADAGVLRLFEQFEAGINAGHGA
ncbi:MAG: hypothetical protein ACR2PL_26975 [Dehalococcoidia bacterium]